MNGLPEVYANIRFGAADDAAARNAALAAAAAVETEAAALVDYRSAGYLLIIGGEAEALAAAKAVGDTLHRTVLVTADATELDTELQAVRDDAAVTVLRGTLRTLEGHLGQFGAWIATANGEDLNIAELNRTGHPWFDLVLDLDTPPALGMEVPPFGYFAPRGDAARLERALAEIPQMTGEFEKPRFFNYSPDICAHGDSGLTGCTRCLDACPTSAITSLGDLIEVDPYLCQGGGSCATACPTGAIIYAYPTPKDQLAQIRALLSAYREAGGSRPVLLFHDEEQGLEILVALAPELPANVVPVQVAEVGAVGMDTWLAALAYGASAVWLLDTPAVARSVRGELEAQQSYVAPIMEALGLAAEQVRMVRVEQDLAAAAGAVPEPVSPAAFDTFNEKRGTLRLAVDHLHTQAAAPPEQVKLPGSAPFGQVIVDTDACTLCMACPQVCPTRALADAGDQPRLDFTEDLCVQCGLCQTACPEDAITLDPRYLFDWEVRRKPRVMNEEEPFHCVVCGTPFATPSVIERMTERLGEHHMFQSEESRRRLQMCGDCRVKDMFAEDAAQGSKPRVFGMGSGS